MNNANAWMSIMLNDGKSPQIKGILCNQEKYPLLFFSQLEALEFWMDNRWRFKVDEKYKTRATPQVVRDTDYPDDVLFDMIDSGERTPIVPVDGFTLYSDAESGTSIL